MSIQRTWTSRRCIANANWITRTVTCITLWNRMNDNIKNSVATRLDCFTVQGAANKCRSYMRCRHLASYAAARTEGDRHDSRLAAGIVEVRGDTKLSVRRTCCFSRVFNLRNRLRNFCWFYSQSCKPYSLFVNPHILRIIHYITRIECLFACSLIY